MQNRCCIGAVSKTKRQGIPSCRKAVSQHGAADGAEIATGIALLMAAARPSPPWLQSAAWSWLAWWGGLPPALGTSSCRNRETRLPDLAAPGRCPGCTEIPDCSCTGCVDRRLVDKLCVDLAHFHAAPERRAGQWLVIDHKSMKSMLRCACRSFAAVDLSTTPSPWCNSVHQTTAGAPRTSTVI